MIAIIILQAIISSGMIILAYRLGIDDARKIMQGEKLFKLRHREKNKGREII